MGTSEGANNILLSYCGRLLLYTGMWFVLHLVFRAVLEALLRLGSRGVKQGGGRDRGRDREASGDDEEDGKTTRYGGLFGIRLTRAAAEKLRMQGPSYVVSTLHAVAQTVRGVRHLVRLVDAPVLLKLCHPLNAAYAAEAFALVRAAGLDGDEHSEDRKFLLENDAILRSSDMLVSYLLCDLVLLFAYYPALGRADMFVHHVTFVICALIGASFQVNLFMFAWLIVGEASTPLLNVRWLLRLLLSSLATEETDRDNVSSNRMRNKTNMKRRETSLKKWLIWTQYAFAAVFFVTRVCIYSAGLLHHVSIMHHFPAYLPKWPEYTILALVVAGFVLNGVWFSVIFSKFVLRR